MQWSSAPKRGLAAARPARADRRHGGPSILLTTIMRASPARRPRGRRRRVPSSMPTAALTTITAVSTAGSAAAPAPPVPRARRVDEVDLAAVGAWRTAASSWSSGVRAGLGLEVADRGRAVDHPHAESRRRSGAEWPRRASSSRTQRARGGRRCECLAGDSQRARS